MALPLTHHVVCPADVLSQVLENEAVILDLGRGVYFGLDEVSTAVWTLVARPSGATVGAIRQTMLDEFDVTEEVLDRDLEAFLGALSARGLVTISAVPPR